MGRAVFGPSALLRRIKNMNSYRHGALTIIESPKSHNETLRALKQIDSRIFLERQVTLEGQAVWCVVVDLGSDEPPITILEWRDTEGYPIHELSSGIVDRVARMDRDPKALFERVQRINQERLDAKKKDTNEVWADLGTDYGRMTSPGHSALLPRGQHLRRARDKRRNRGERI
jgi:hypothetical protein